VENTSFRDNNKKPFHERNFTGYISFEVSLRINRSNISCSNPWIFMIAMRYSLLLRP
jgi:hypothetical protein